MLVFMRSSFPKTDENIPKMNKPAPLWLHNKQNIWDTETILHQLDWYWWYGVLK